MKVAKSRKVTELHTLRNSRVLTSVTRNYAFRLEKFYRRKFGDTVTPVALLKTLAIISSSFRKNWKLFALNVAPSRHLKSLTSLIQKEIFSKDRLVYVGSDFTIHGMAREYDSGKKLDGKCLINNDMTLLLASKAFRTKARLIGGLAELGSEGEYHYSDFDASRKITARFSLIANITPHSYAVNHEDLLENTFVNRCLVAYHCLRDAEMTDGFLDRGKRDTLKIERFHAKLREDNVKVSRRDMVQFVGYAKNWRNIGGYSSISQVGDMVKSVAVAYAILSGHRKMTKAEFRYLDLLTPYLRNPAEAVKLRISQLHREGKTVKEICEILNQTYSKYKAFVYRTIAEYREKGILER